VIDSARLFDKLSGKFGNNILTTSVSFGEPVVVAQKSVVRDVLVFLKTDPELSFDMLVELFCVDYPENDPRFEIAYILRSMKHNGRISIKAKIHEDDVETVSDLWKAANFLEREAYDMFGIRFRNHPDLRRIYNADDFEGYPLRKDFSLEGRDYDKPFHVDLEEKKV